jgi:hypothetical protein
MTDVGVIDSTYLGSNSRGGVPSFASGDIVAVVRTTEWSMLSKNNFDTIASPLFECFFRWANIFIKESNRAASSTNNSPLCPVCTGSSKKRNFLNGPMILRHGYEGYAPYEYFKFRVSIKDPNGLHAERITGPESEVVLVTASIENKRFPVQYSESENGWFGEDATGITIKLSTKRTL